MNLLKAITLAKIICICATYIYRAEATAFPTSVFILSWIVNLFLLSGWRIIAKEIIRPKRRVFIIGEGEESEIVKTEIKKYKKEYILVEDKLDNLPNLIKSNKVTDIILTVSHTKNPHSLEKLFEYEKYNIRVMAVPDTFESMIGKLNSVRIEAVPLIDITPPQIIGWNGLVKRLLDISLSLIILILTIPLFIIIPILIKLDSQGPVFYKQERVGKDGKIFNIYKFRSMHTHAEAKLGPVLAKADDERVTKFGKFLRKTRLDELPQFINVLLGKMSIVGPRPERPFFVKEFESKILGYSQRFKVKPGITGLAQVNAAYDISPENKLKYDLLYIKNYSLFLDFKILLKTIWTVLLKKGAH
jgi:exopolysaccharide biosynthesis polyprenyl glycosylphosphotransferase